MRNTIILAVILFVAVLAASLFYFRSLDKEHNLAAKPLRFLPDNTLLIVATHNNEITDNIFKDFEVFDAILGFDYTAQLARLKKHVLRNETLAPFVDDTELYFSFHREGAQSAMLITIPVNTDLGATDIASAIKGAEDNYRLTSRDTLGATIYRLGYDDNDSAWHAMYHQRTIFVSESTGLLSKILDKSTRHLPEDQIDFFLKSNTRNTPLSVYFPHQQFDSVASLYQRRPTGVFLDLFRKLYGQSAWNINYKQDALILTGESEMDQYSENYISLFKNQEKTTQYLYNYFPANTAVYMEYSVSDRSRFQKELRDLFKRRGENVSPRDTSGLMPQLQEALGDEFAFVETSNQNYIGFIRQRDSTAWKALQEGYLDVVDDSIARFKTSGVLYNYLGDAFKEFSRPYVTVVDSVVVVANSSQTLRGYRNDWARRNLLIGTLGFKNFEKLQGNDANVTFFLHSSNARSKILNTLPAHYRQNYTNESKFGFRDFYSWSAQFSGNNGKFSSQLYAVYKSKNALGVTPEWTYSLQDRAITPPYVFEHSDTSKFVLIQELNHTIHGIHPSGRNLWSVVLSGRVVGDVQQLPDRSIVLVTDRNRLYRFDTQGKGLPGFSVALPEEPTHTPTIGSRRGADVIYVPTSDKVLVYDFQGNRVEEWTATTLSGRIVGSVQLVGRQVAVGTADGGVYLLDEDGHPASVMRLDEGRVIGNPIAATGGGTTAPRLMLTDTAGVLYTWESGSSTLQPYQLEGVGATHSSDFRALRSPSAADMVVVDQTLLRVFDVQEAPKVLFSYNFTRDISDRPQYFVSATERGKQLIGISSRATRLIYVFEPNGTVLEGFPVVGQPGFYYGDINYNSGPYLLVMRNDHKLYAFRDQK